MVCAGVVATRISTICPAAGPTGAKRTGRRPTGSKLAELRVNPGAAARNLVDDLDGPHAAHPATEARYQVLKRDTAGFSITYRALDERGREWNALLAAGGSRRTSWAEKPRDLG
jgi:hypothetical protein